MIRVLLDDESAGRRGTAFSCQGGLDRDSFDRQNSELGSDLDRKCRPGSNFKSELAFQFVGGLWLTSS